MMLRYSRAQVSALLAGASLLGGACNALDAPGPEGSVVVIPTDDRPALLPATPPTPISGGTLAVSADGLTAVAADPDRDRVSVVDLVSGAVKDVPLRAGDEPGRVLLDGAGRGYVALRRGGALAVIELASASVIERVPVCAAPRGMAFDGQGLLHVACMDGRLLSLRNPTSAPAVGEVATTPPPTAALEVVRDLQVELDLRDVFVSDNKLWVSTFKRAEVLQVSDMGQVQQRFKPATIAKSSIPTFGFDSTAQAKAQAATLQPHLAYRSLPDAAGGMFILHQGESDEEVAIDEPQEQGASPYGGGGSCTGIVIPSITKIDRTGRVTTMPVSTGVLSVDMAFSPSDNLLAVVQAGNRDDGAPQRQTFFSDDGSSATSSAPNPFGVGTSAAVSVFDVKKEDQSGCTFGSTSVVSGQSTAIAFRPRAGTSIDATTQAGWVVQSREPARLTVLPLRADFDSPGARIIELGGASVHDSGHELFHRDAGGGIACASCHGEGGEDGHTWNFTSLGLRRTQALNIGLEGTAPFHWGGDESDIDNLMSDVFVGRMGGVHQSGARVSALSRWLFALEPVAAPVPADSFAVERGRELFMSSAVGCNDCHSGAKLTNNKNVDVGTGAALQVPSLRGIAYRAPFMHTGCAATLRDRFESVCGGQRHGNTQDLAPESIDDLVAFLQTL